MSSVMGNGPCTVLLICAAIATVFVAPITSLAIETFSNETSPIILRAPFAVNMPGVTTRGVSKSCQPSFGNNGFSVCLFNNTGGVVTNLASALGNALWSVNNQAFLMGRCYCRQDCSPAQIVCERPSILAWFGIKQNLPNQLAQLVFVAEQWSLFCYCPDKVPPGTNPCVLPQKPQICDPE